MGACVTRDDKVKEWFVKVPDLKMVEDSSSVASPSVTCVPDKGQGLQEYVLEPTNPATRGTVACQDVLCNCIVALHVWDRFSAHNRQRLQANR